MKHILSLLLLLYSLLLSGAYADSTSVVEELEYVKEKIGSIYNFNEDMVYVDLSSSEKKLKNNGGIEMQVTRAMIANIAKNSNTELQFSPIPSDMSFKLIRVLREVHNLDKWDDSAKEAYLSFASNNPDTDMLFVLEDANGTISTAMPGTFRKAVVTSGTNKTLNNGRP